MSQICLNELSTAPLAPGTNKVRIYVGTDGILRSIDDAGVITVYAPAVAIGSFLQYTSNANLNTNSITGVAIPLDQNLNSDPNGLLTKVNATDFRVNVKSFVHVNYTANPYSLTNDRGYRVFVRQNSTDLQWTECYGWSKNLQGRVSGVSGSFIIQCEVNDIIQFRLASPEGVSTNLDSGKVTVNVEVFKIRP